MHLGFTDRSFVPHNLISAQETPVPLPKFQMAPRFKILISSGSKKGTQIYFFSLKNPGKRTLLPGPLWRKTTLYRAFCISLKNLIKIPLNKKAVRKKRPPMFPKSGAPIEADAHFQALLTISFEVPSKGALPQGPLYGIPRREMPRS